MPFGVRAAILPNEVGLIFCNAGNINRSGDGDIRATQSGNDHSCLLVGADLAAVNGQRGHAGIGNILILDGNGAVAMCGVALAINGAIIQRDIGACLDPEHISLRLGVLVGDRAVLEGGIAIDGNGSLKCDVFKCNVTLKHDVVRVPAGACGSICADGHRRVLGNQLRPVAVDLTQVQIQLVEYPLVAVADNGDGLGVFPAFQRQNAGQPRRLGRVFFIINTFLFLFFIFRCGQDAGIFPCFLRSKKQDSPVNLA